MESVPCPTGVSPTDLESVPSPTDLDTRSGVCLQICRVLRILQKIWSKGREVARITVALQHLTLKIMMLVRKSLLFQQQEDASGV